VPVRGRAGVSAALRTALRAEVRRVRQLADQADRVRAVSDALATIEAEHERLSRERLEAIRRLRRDGLSYTQISQATGLSRTRVAQLAREAGAN